MMRMIVTGLVVLALALSVAACGKKGPPKAPGKDQYPRQYPAPL